VFGLRFLFQTRYAGTLGVEHVDDMMY